MHQSGGYSEDTDCDQERVQGGINRVYIIPYKTCKDDSKAFTKNFLVKSHYLIIIK